MSTTKKTLLVFSGDFDRALGAFTIANGAAAMGDDVTMFFAFWGLNILRKPQKVATKKGVIQAAFGRMMPRGVEHLRLSKMNFGGVGSALIKRVMKQQNIMSIQQMIDSAKEQGVKLLACTMSMGVMGFKEEELIDGVELAGVAAYLGEADEANVNLFI